MRTLKLGDMVYLDGEIVITAGLPTHQRILEYIDAASRCRSTSRRALFFISAATAATGGAFRGALHESHHQHALQSADAAHHPHFGLRAVGGKGGLDRASADAMQEIGCVYLSFLGGGAPLLHGRHQGSVAVAWDDLSRIIGW